MMKQICFTDASLLYIPGKCETNREPFRVLWNKNVSHLPKNNRFFSSFWVQNEWFSQKLQIFLLLWNTQSFTVLNIKFSWLDVRISFDFHNIWAFKLIYLLLVDRCLCWRSWIGENETKSLLIFGNPRIVLRSSDCTCHVCVTNFI